MFSDSKINNEDNTKASPKNNYHSRNPKSESDLVG